MFRVSVICVAAFFIQTITANCINGGLAANYGLSNGLLNNGYGNQGNINPALTSGGCLQVTSYSPIAPTGLQVLAENLVIEGPLQVGGSLPLLGAVALEGAVPTGGQAGASYGCGNGNVGIISEIGNGVGVAGISGTGIPGAGISAATLGGIGGGINPAAIGAANLGLNGGLSCNRLQ